MKTVLPHGMVTGNVSQGFAVFETVDERGNRGGLVAVSRDSQKAEKMAAGAGWYGGQGRIVQGTLFDGPDGLVFIEKAYSIEALDTHLPRLAEQKRQAALAKLTDEDKKVLGIRD